MELINARPLTQKDIEDFSSSLRGEIQATLTVRFSDVPTSFMYFGIVTQEAQYSGTLRGFTLTPSASERVDEAQDENTGLSIEQNLDQAMNLTTRDGGADCTMLQWSGSGVRMQLEVDYDAP